MAGWLMRVIGRPQQAHGVASAEAYREKARAVLKGLGRPPVLTSRNERPPAYVSDGRWVIDCVLCNNGPSASPEWELAICCECGAEYRPTFPENREAVERALLARAHPSQRHYFPAAAVAARKGLGKPETLADLHRENAEHGVPPERGG